MACFEHQSFMSPRISFSNDFIDPSQTMIKLERSPAAPPPDASDFEFSVSGYNMIAADEIFFKGKLIPLKENCTTQLQRMTLGDKLCVDDDDDEKEVSHERPVRGPVRWKELLGLRKSSYGMTKKQEVERSPLGRRSSFITSNVTASINKASSQEMEVEEVRTET